MWQIHVDTGKNVAIYVTDKGLVNRLYEMRFQIYNRNVFWKCGQKIHFVERENPKPTNIMERLSIALIQCESELKPQSYLILQQTGQNKYSSDSKRWMKENCTLIQICLV